MISDSPEQGAEPDERVSSLVNEYFDRRQADEDLTPERLADEHPDLSGVLQPYLVGMALVDNARMLAEAIFKPEMMPPMPTIPGFQIIREIGRGGMGVVYQALQLSTKRTVALKVMVAGPFASASVRRRFDREVELAARLQHAAIVRVLESGEAAGHRYYAMDYVDGVRLDHYLAATPRDLRAILNLFIEICEAVEYAHAHGVVHRDLKPTNVLIDGEGHPHILDFGLAKATHPGESEEPETSCVSLPGQVLGTLFYLSPEQAVGAPSEVDQRTDVYALGVTLFESLTGSLPFETTGRPSEVIRRIVEDAPKLPSSLSKQVKPDLETIILKALAKEKQRRYQSAADLADDLRRFMAGEPILARRPSSAYILRKKLSKHRLAAGAGAGILVLLALGLIATFSGRQREWQQARAQAVNTIRVLDAFGPNQALGMAEEGYKLHPDLPEACLVWAQTQYANPGTRNQAIRFLEAELQGAAPHWTYRMLLAEIYQRAGETERSAALQRQTDIEAPDTPESWYLRSFATLDRPNAARYAGEAVQRQTDHRLAWYRLAFLRSRIGDLDGANEAAERLIQLEGNATAWVTFKGDVLARQGRLEEAIQAYTQAATLKPRTPESFHARGHVYRRMKRYPEAEADYTKALELEGETTANVWSLYQRATPRWILGRADEAAEDYRRVRILLGRPFYSDARRFLILREQGRTVEAEQVLKTALQDVEAGWLRQIFRCLNGQITSDALVAEAQADNDLQRLCEACYYAGEVCRLAGNRVDARKWFEQCVQTGLLYDQQTSGGGTPMNEYELAQWRLETLSAAPDPASQSENP